MPDTAEDALQTLRALKLAEAVNELIGGDYEMTMAEAHSVLRQIDAVHVEDTEASSDAAE